MRALGPPTGPPDPPEEHPRAPEVDKRKPRFYYNKTNMFANGRATANAWTAFGVLLATLLVFLCSSSICFGLLRESRAPFKHLRPPKIRPGGYPRDTALRIARPQDRRPRMGRERPLLATHRFWFAVFQCLMLSVLALASYQPLFLNL